MTRMQNYTPSEHLAVEEVILLFKVRAFCKQYIPKSYKCSGINIYISDEPHTPYLWHG
jgi:hypothetical protein